MDARAWSSYNARRFVTSCFSGKVSCTTGCPKSAAPPATNGRRQIRGRGAHRSVCSRDGGGCRELCVPPRNGAAFSDGHCPSLWSDHLASVRRRIHEPVWSAGSPSRARVGTAPAINGWLARRAAEVYTIERVGALLSAARALLELARRVRRPLLEGDGSLGWPESHRLTAHGDAAAPHVPKSLVVATRRGGRW
jgi:hypothetical protein